MHKSPDRTVHATLGRIAAAAFALLAFTVQAQDKPVELKFANWLPANHSLAKNGFEPWAKSLEAASKGSIKVVFFPAQQLGKAADHYDMARDGIADVTYVNPGYQGGPVPDHLGWPASCPFVFWRWQARARSALDALVSRLYAEKPK